MAQVSTSASCAANGNFRITAYLDVSEKSTNVAGNYSTISWHLVVKGTGTANYRFSGSSRSHAGYVIAAVNGGNVYSGYTGLPNGFTNGTVLIDRSGTTNVGHNNDGTKSCSFSVDLNQSDDDYGRINYYFNDGPLKSGSINLTTIPRASQPSINTWPANSPDITCGQECTIHMNRKSDSFTHTVSWSFGTLSGQTEGLAQTSGVTYNVSWTPPLSMMSQIPNSQTGTGTVTVTTYNGSTLIGSKSVSFTLHQPADAVPTISASYAEIGTLADGKTTLASKGVGSTTVIGQISKKQITVTVSTKYSSTLKSITCTHNGNTQTASASPGVFTFEAPVNTGDGKSYFSWNATDSRGNVTSGSISMDFIDYKKPVTAAIVPQRDSAVVSTGTVKASGTFFNGKIGNIQNDISVTILYNNRVVPKVTKDGNNWSCSSAISGVSPSESYTFQVSAVDSLGYGTPSPKVVLQKALPTLWIGKDTVRINSHLMVGDKSLLDLTYPVGSVYLSINGTNPGTLFGGTWKQISQGRVLWGADNNHKGGDTIDAGLPNISGGFQIRQWENTNLLAVQGSGNSGENSGPFKFVKNGSGSKWGNQVTGSRAATANTDLISFNAQQANGIYGKSNTVQPPALVVYIWQRTE